MVKKMLDCKLSELFGNQITKGISNIREQMKKVMGPGTKYITIVRDPVDMFESAYVYYKMYSAFNMTLGNPQSNLN